MKTRNFLRTLHFLRPLQKETITRRSNMKYNFVSKSGQERPLVLLLPWLGATSNSISKYADIYKDSGMEVLVHRIEVQDFLWPRRGLISSKRLLDDLKKRIGNDTQKETPLVIHGFSIGCYFYALMLMHMRGESGSEYDSVYRNIATQIIDSPVVGTLEEMATGVSKMMSSNRFMSAVYRNVCLAYFAVTKNYTVNIFEESIDTIVNKCPSSPMLVMSCKNDPMVVPEVLEEHVATWRKNGTFVIFKMWEKSSHALHLKQHREEYEGLVEDILMRSFVPEKKQIKSKL